MADMLYRNPDPMVALQESLFGPPTVPFVPTTPHDGTMPEQSILERPDIQQLMAAMFPQQEPEAHPVANEVGARLADALSAYAAGMGAGNPMHQLQDLRARREGRKGLSQERARAELGIKLQEVESGRRTKERTQDSELEKARLAEEKKFKTDQTALELKARSEESAADRSSREKIASQGAETDKLLARIRSGDTKAELALKERLHKAEGTTVDEVDERSKKKGMREAAQVTKDEISGVADNIDAVLQKKSPAQLREILERDMDKRGLDDESRRDVRAFFEKWVEPKLREVEGAQSAQPAAGGGRSLWDYWPHKPGR